MKSLSITLIACFLFFHSYGQNQSKFTIEQSSIQAEEVIKLIEMKSNYKISYLPSWVNDISANIKVENASVEEVLAQIFENTDINFFIQNDQIVLTQNISIRSELPEYFFENTNQRQSISTKAISSTVAGLVFTKEIMGQGELNTTEEDQVIIIGNQSLFKKGSNYILSGQVVEEKSGEPLFGVMAFFEDPYVGVLTDLDGKFRLSVPGGNRKIKFQFTGMKTTSRKLLIYSDGDLKVQMTDQVVALNEVVVQADRDRNVEQTLMGTTKVTMKEIKNIPNVMGENDLVKVALTLPGVQTVGEGSSGFNVRGGKADQNLILLNNSPLYNPSHFFGFFSVFNPDAVESMELYKSSMPARYGGRLSSVMDVKIRDGNKNKFSGQGGIGLVTGRMVLEAPIIENKLSIIAGGRSTYSDWVLNQINESSIKNSKAFFYDFVTKISLDANEKNQFDLTLYNSHDDFKLSSDSLISFNNTNIAFEWKRFINERWDSNLSATVSNYKYQVDYDRVPTDAFAFDFNIRETEGKLDIGYYPQDEHRILMGASVKAYAIEPGNLKKSSDESLISPIIINQENAIESALHISDDWDLTDRLSLNIGLRYSLFQARGPATVYQYTDGLPKTNDNRIGEKNYSQGDVIAQYSGPEWRFSARYKLPSSASIKASINRTRQYIHMLSNTVSVSPTDIWKLSDQHVKPQIGDQYSVGYFQNLNRGEIEISIEGYFKETKNVLDYKTGASLLLNENIETEVLQGEGKAYGLEFFVKKKTGKLNGWISYTYSRSMQKFNSEFAKETINKGQWFPSNYDKPHNFNLIGNYRFTKRISFSNNVVFSTGRPITYPLAIYSYAGAQRLHYSERNAYRIRNYFRVDIGINIEGNHKINKLAHSSWNFSIYNILGRNNPYSVFFETSQDGIKGYELSIFAYPIPSITYNFKF